MGHIGQQKGHSGELCNPCQRQQRLIANGGRGLSSSERAAVARFHGSVVSDDGVGEIEGSSRELVWGDNVFVDFGDHSNRLAVF